MARHPENKLARRILGLRRDASKGQGRIAVPSEIGLPQNFSTPRLPYGLKNKSWAAVRARKFAMESNRRAVHRLGIRILDRKIRDIESKLEKADPDEADKIKMSLNYARSLRATAGRKKNKVMPLEAQQFSLGAKRPAASGFSRHGFGEPTVDYANRAQRYSSKANAPTKKTRGDPLLERAMAKSFRLRHNRSAALQVIAELGLTIGSGKDAASVLERKIANHFSRANQESALQAFRTGRKIVEVNGKWVPESAVNERIMRKQLKKRRRKVMQGLGQSYSGLLSTRNFILEARALDSPEERHSSIRRFNQHVRDFKDMLGEQKEKGLLSNADYQRLMTIEAIEEPKEPR